VFFSTKVANFAMTQKLNTLSEHLLLAVKKREPTEGLRQQLAGVSLVELQGQLPADAQRLAFWINLYNAYFLYLRRDLGVEKAAIYRQQRIPFAGFRLSLDDIEHGILRRRRCKWALGYLPGRGYPPSVKYLQVDQFDYRIHFALNCGAQSCPPIACYQPAHIDQQLEMAATSFLEQETIIDATTRTVHLTRLALWYLGDFGGYRGIRRMLRKHIQLPKGHWRIQFQTYNWDENLANFV
jgi:hypothetical protein